MAGVGDELATNGEATVGEADPFVAFRLGVVGAGSEDPPAGECFDAAADFAFARHGIEGVECPPLEPKITILGGHPEKDHEVDVGEVFKVDRGGHRQLGGGKELSEGASESEVEGDNLLFVHGGRDGGAAEGGDIMIIILILILILIIIIDDHL